MITWVDKYMRPVKSTFIPELVGQQNHPVAGDHQNHHGFATWTSARPDRQFAVGGFANWSGAARELSDSL